MFCNQCGMQVPDNASVCPNCGANVGQNLSSVQVPQQPVQTVNAGQNPPPNAGIWSAGHADAAAKRTDV